jgi:hypothetical protein
MKLERPVASRPVSCCLESSIIVVTAELPNQRSVRSTGDRNENLRDWERAYEAPPYLAMPVLSLPGCADSGVIGGRCRLIGVCPDAGARLAVNHQMRFIERHIGIKAPIDAPELGDLWSVVASATW